MLLNSSFTFSTFLQFSRMEAIFPGETADNVKIYLKELDAHIGIHLLDFP